MSKRRPQRTYDASRRKQRALETQERVLEVARRLFADRGYAETTLDAIASEAGVALPTLYAAFGSKKGLLSRLVGRLVSGEPGSPSVLQTAKAKEVLSDPDPHRALALFAAHMNEILQRIGPTYEAMKSASRTETDAADMFSRAQANRLANLETVAKRLAQQGALRKGLSVEDAGKTLWALASAEVRQLLTVHGGWSSERYQEWLGQTLSAALLAD
jgi:TetR/AcrR family transcriptional regulator, regulator of autoinduction and epiphytic fitness